MFWNKDKIPNLKTEEDDIDYFKMDDEQTEDEIIEEASIEEIEEEKKEEQEKEKEKFTWKNINFHDEQTIKLTNKVLNILLIIIIVVAALITTDVLLVSRKEIGPFFAIKTKTHNDGGTKEYYGLGYKVIKYNEEEGRKDIIIGPWSLEYDTTIEKTTILDLALDFTNNKESSLERYMNKYLQVSGTIDKIEPEKITLTYKDEENKYTTSITCNILNNTTKYKKKDNIKLVGTLYNYKENKTLTLYMKNCYIK